MQTTGSINFDNKKSFRRLKKHLTHDSNVKHSNNYLNSDESKKLRHLNRHVVNEDFNKLIEKNYKDYIEKHNESASKHGNYVWTSTDDFIKHNAHGERRTASVGSLMVFKFSDFDDFNNMVDGYTKEMQAKNSELTDFECKEQFIDACCQGLEEYSKSFHSRNPNLYMTEAYIHGDEEGSPHGHGRILPLTATNNRGKKMSWGLNRALREQFGDKDTRNNLSMFRQQEDKMIVEYVNKSLNKLFEKQHVKSYNVSLLRKHSSVVGLKHDEYLVEKKRERMQSRQAELALTSQELSEKSADLDDRTVSVKEREEIVQDTETDFSKREEDLNKREDDLNEQTDYLNSRENQITAREQDVSRRESALNVRESRLDERETDVKKRENEAKKREEETKKQLESAIKLQKQSAEQFNVIQKIRTEYQDFYNKIQEKWKRFTNWLALKKENYPKEPDISTLVNVQKKRKKTVDKINHDVDNDGIDDRFELPKIPDSYDLQLTENNKEEEQKQRDDSKNY